MYGRSNFTWSESSSLERGESVHRSLVRMHAAALIQMRHVPYSQMGSRTRKLIDRVRECVCVCDVIRYFLKIEMENHHSRLNATKDVLNILWISVSVETRVVKLKARVYSARSIWRAGNRISIKTNHGILSKSEDFTQTH